MDNIVGSKTDVLAYHHKIRNNNSLDINHVITEQGTQDLPGDEATSLLWIE